MGHQQDCEQLIPTNVQQLRGQLFPSLELLLKSVEKLYLHDLIGSLVSALFNRSSKVEIQYLLIAGPGWCCSI